MKKLFYLSVALLCAVTVTAQTVSKSGNSSRSYSSGGSNSTSSASKSSSSSAHSSNNYSSKSSNGGSAASSASTSNSFEKSDTYAYGWSENIKDHKNYYRSTGTKFNPTNNITFLRSYNLAMANIKNEKELAHNETVIKLSKDDFTQALSGIHKVGSEEARLLNHSDKDKYESVANAGENGSTNAANSASNDSLPFGAAEIEIAKKVHTNPNYVARSMAGCSDAEFTNIVYWRGVLKSYEVYDISQLNDCHENFPKEIVVEVSCTEFENSSDERKAHIINNPNFYDVKGLNSCPAYIDYITAD